jgi:site-specific DNA recombinase
MRTAAIYARVSSDKQREEHTIASQTAALIGFAREHQFEVPPDWVIEDDGVSGTSLIRPGLERVRDLAAEGLIQAVLVYAPDRLSRRYAYQVLLIEEFARAGVETLFVRTPRGSTPEDELLVQFQGMIAEYERAQIVERSRRGKRHRARLGEVSVLSGAPFGYRFVRKTDHSAAYYQINEEQARVVRRIFEFYCVEGAQHQRHCPSFERAGGAHLQAARALGTPHGVEDSAQPCLQGRGLLRQNRDRAAPADHPPDPPAGRLGHARQRPV